MYKVFKRILDVIVSITGLLLFAPIMLITAFFIKIDSEGPIIFRQERLGYKGRVFSMYKFRTMNVGAEKGGVYESKNDSRVTKVGRLLRKTSLDELPQFFNMLKGDMSLIGPRPVLTYHPWALHKYNKEQVRMFSVKPGLTGWAQVNGRKNVNWNDRIAMNIFYVDNISLFLDIKILLKTISVVIGNKDNINETESLTEDKKI